METCADFPLGTTDAPIVALAQRLSSSAPARAAAPASAEIVQGDAGITTAGPGAAPADVLL